MPNTNVYIKAIVKLDERFGHLFFIQFLQNNSGDIEQKKIF